ncbi:hypothetical protein [Streptomyces sp. SID10853]|uniref:hypothetical protein n=1 Tax=Streptomyces sp. SID10853 TaxID=2706028 RepID=UPI0013DB003E|nr:hypothetical protein [Streptomyces sp. SID10853]
MEKISDEVSRRFIEGVPSAPEQRRRPCHTAIALKHSRRPLDATAPLISWQRQLALAANSHDVAVNGFEDLQFYRELALPNSERSLLAEVAVEGDLREKAADSLTEWAAQLPVAVVPKL